MGQVWFGDDILDDDKVARRRTCLGKLYKGETVVEMEQGLGTELHVLEREERVIRDQSELEVKRAEVLDKLAKMFCEMINLEDVRGDKCLEVWLEKIHETFPKHSARAGCLDRFHGLALDNFGICVLR